MEPISGTDSTLNRPDGERPLNAPLILSDWPDYLRQLRNEVAWQTNDRNAITLVHTEYVRVVLMTFKHSAEMKEHAADGNAVIQVLEGRIWLQTPEYSHSISAGAVAALKPRLPHSLFAEEESAILLILTPGEGGRF